MNRNKVSISLTEKGAKIRLSESYDLFSKVDVECSISRDIQPLISFDLETKMMIKFDSLWEVAFSCNNVFVLQEPSMMEKTIDSSIFSKELEEFSDKFCRRSLSILPREIKVM